MNDVLKKAHFERITDEKARRVYDYLCSACAKREGGRSAPSGMTDADQMRIGLRLR